MHSKSKRIRSIVLLTLLGSISPGILAAVGEMSTDNVWTSISVGELDTKNAASARPSAEPWIRPDKFKAVEIEPTALEAILVASPNEVNVQARNSAAILTLPRPDGQFERFAIVESPVMHPDLEQWMANEGWPMKTYSGTSLDNPATTARFDWGGPAGFHAMVDSPDGDYFIDPYWRGNTRVYASYYRKDYTLQGQGKPFRCEVGDTDGATASQNPVPIQPLWKAGSASVTTGGNLREYRLAMAATGEYTTFHGGSKALGQAAITTTVNRINMVYMRDFSVKMNLIANNMDLVYTDGASDPYTDDDCGAMLDQNQLTIDAEIGTANYDIGHVSGTGGGGIATLYSPCNNATKARGCTGGPSPIGDPFDIDFVAHEMGHQFGGNHTWSGEVGNCSAGQFESTAAYEPGSGSTIQAYAGICGADNLQANSDDHFHRKSLDEMGTFINGAGACFATTSGVNPNEPVANAGGNFNIPMGTPFELTGSGSDADGDTLTYNWEQFDLAPEQELLSVGDDGDGPIFRSWPSTASSTRVFPRIQDVAAGTLSPGEVLPVEERTLNFTLTVRDNRAGGGREDDDAMTVDVDADSGPFMVTAPNGGESFAEGEATIVTWDVADTTAAPINTPNVDIFLSADGGLTYPVTLLTDTPNDGSQNVTLPTSVSIPSARVKVKGAGNVFFDISDNDFMVNTLSQCESPGITIPESGPPNSVSDQMIVASATSLTDLDLKLDIAHTWVGDLTVTLEHVDTGTSVVVLDRPGEPAGLFGCSKDDIEATLDDEATLPVEDECASTIPAIAGTFTPNNPLSAFDGENLAGTWKLTVADAAVGDGGALNTWCLVAPLSVTGCPAILGLSNQTLSGAPPPYQATASATLGPALIVNGTNIVINAPTVVFENGVTIGGTFTAGNTTTCT